jgi:hypothetical protein
VASLIVSEDIPPELLERVRAALAWVNESADTEWEVTGIVDPEEALVGGEDLHLILCGGDRCEQKSFRVRGQPGARPAELDPPPGPRRAWLDGVLAQHAFVVLLFYRGFW